MKEYTITAMVEYDDTIIAESEEEAIEKFIVNCPYSVDETTIEVGTDDDTIDKKPETISDDDRYCGGY